MQRRLDELLLDHGAYLDGNYVCPHHPEFTGPCPCRKPGLKLFHDAGNDLGIAFEKSWFIGDRPSDVEPGRRLGGRCFLVATGEGALHERQALALAVPVLPTLADAVREILE